MKENILFLRFGSFSNINDEIHTFLKNQYPNCNIKVVDAWTIVKQRISIFQLVINIYFFALEYSPDLVSGRKQWKDFYQWFFATSYISLRIQKEISKLSNGKNYKFVFQSQSLFNGALKNTPYFIYTDHTTKANLLYPDIRPESYIRSKNFIKKCETEAYNEASLIFTFGNFTRKSLINQYRIAEENVIAIGAGSNSINHSELNKNKYSNRNILFVGKEWERKGGPILLSVFEIVLKEFPDATLTIVGCKPKNVNLPNCNIIGKVPLQEVFQYYNEASLFCFPTLREPFGIVIIEAMINKLPVIANNVGSIPDLVIQNQNGFLVNNNVGHYAKHICDLFNNPQKSEQLGNYGAQLAKAKFTWEIVGKKIKHHIDKKLNEYDI